MKDGPCGKQRNAGKLWLFWLCLIVSLCARVPTGLTMKCHFQVAPDKADVVPEYVVFIYLSLFFLSVQREK